MKDWAFNRQRYWGEPIPIIHCEKCGMVPEKEENLPIKLPVVDKFEPAEDGESPLANIKEFVETTCPVCGGSAKRETDTMPQWAGSSWYFLRYIDPRNNKVLADFDKLKYWLQVDWYNGGMEHVTRHVIYSRFWHQFLFDIGVVPTEEPYKKRTAQGLILGSDGDKMSKSKGNVVNPLEIIEEYGADTLRLYILFIGDYEQSTPWNPSGVKGARRFLDKILRLKEKVTSDLDFSKNLKIIMNQTIKQVSEDIENVKFNTAIAKLMTLVNEMVKQETISRKDYETILKLVNPFAPHLAEEMWEQIGNKDGLVFEKWPEYDEDSLVDNMIEIAISVNGKVRDKMIVDLNTSKDELQSQALASEKVKSFIEGKEIRKIIVVPKKLVNIVV